MDSSAWTTGLLVLAVLLSGAVHEMAVSAVPVPNPDPEIRSKRYVVTVPAAVVNLTGWVPQVVPLGQALFSSRPYIIG